MCQGRGTQRGCKRNWHLRIGDMLSGQTSNRALRRLWNGGWFAINKKYEPTPSQASFKSDAEHIADSPFLKKNKHSTHHKRFCVMKHSAFFVFFQNWSNRNQSLQKGHLISGWSFAHHSHQKLEINLWAVFTSSAYGLYMVFDSWLNTSLDKPKCVLIKNRH